MNRTRLLIALAGVAAATTAHADIIGRVTIVANDATTGAQLGSASWDLPAIGTDGTSSVSWGALGTDQTNPNAISLGGAMIHGIQARVVEDPVVQVNFNVASGLTNATFTVSSVLLTFPVIPSAVGVASAFIGVTDSATFGTPGMVSVTGLQPGSNAFAARYNGNTATFANLIPTTVFNMAPGGSQAITGQSSSFPLYDTIPGAVSDMQSEFKFTLSSFDRAVGTSTFEIVPAPGAVALLGLGGLLAARRRRA